MNSHALPTQTSKNAPTCQTGKVLPHLLLRTPALTGGIKECDCGGRSGLAGYCEACHRKRITGLHATSAVSQPGDRWEQEADQLAKQVLAEPGKISRSSAALRSGDVLMRQPVNSSPAVGAAASVQAVLQTPGQPLDLPTRAFMEPRFGHDFSQVRVHTDDRAAKSTRAVNALAYVVGRDVVFAAGQYLPHTWRGRHLLAHELAHFVLQHPILARTPCLSTSVCQNILTPSQLLAQARTGPNQVRRQQRRTNCSSVPPAPACRADGHAARAVQVERLLRQYDPLRMQNIQGIFIDMDIEGSFGALTTSCANFMPPLATSGHCIAIPRGMEDNARIFNTTTGSRTIDGMERGQWRERTLEILVHEAGHVDFRTRYMAGFMSRYSSTVPNIMGRQRPTCRRDQTSRVDVFSSANELAAMIQEFPRRMQYIRTSVRLSTPQARTAELEDWRNHRIRGIRQSITNSLRVIRCMCGCQDADNMIRETILFATDSWTQRQKDELHDEMNNPMWNSLDLHWPFFSSTHDFGPGDYPERSLPQGKEYA